MDLLEGPAFPMTKPTELSVTVVTGTGRSRRSRWAWTSMSRMPAWKASWKSWAVYTAAMLAGASPATPSGGVMGDGTSEAYWIWPGVASTSS